MPLIIKIEVFIFVLPTDSFRYQYHSVSASILSAKSFSHGHSSDIKTVINFWDGYVKYWAMGFFRLENKSKKHIYDLLYYGLLFRLCLLWESIGGWDLAIEGLRIARHISQPPRIINWVVGGILFKYANQTCHLACLCILWKMIK